ncbi:acyltransferase [Microbacterium sp. KHB019]
MLARRRLFNIWMNAFVSSELVPEHARWMLLRASGIRAERCLIDSGGYIGSRRIEIGRGSSLNRCVFLDGSDRVVIGRNVSIGMNALVVTGSHEEGGPDNRAGGAFTTAPVRIEDGAWIGAGSVILPGVTIGRGAIVASASLVMKDVAPNTVVMGNPARVVRHIDDDPAADSAPAVPR